MRELETMTNKVHTETSFIGQKRVTSKPLGEMSVKLPDSVPGLSSSGGSLVREAIAVSL